MAEGNAFWQTENNDEVATAPELWRPLRKAIGGFDLDPASGCEPTPIADERYTEADDGLTSAWWGNVWLNPPFSDKEAWFKRLVNQYNNGDVDRAVAITKVGTDEDWFQDWFSTADVICFLDGRGWYLESGSESWATMVGVWNPTDEILDRLNSMGCIVQPKTDTDQTELF